jgi:hypothetical protein
MLLVLVEDAPAVQEGRMGPLERLQKPRDPRILRSHVEVAREHG